MQSRSRNLCRASVLILALALWGCGPEQEASGFDSATSTWQLGEPITTYWAGPKLTDAVAARMSEGGWNLVWCTETTLDVAQRHGLRALLTDPLLKPASLDDERSRAELDAFIERVKDHPALYSYHLKGELNASKLPDWARLVRYIRQRDSRHAVDSNLYPTYARNRQLGVSGDKASAYREYVRKFIEIFKPDFLSFAHYNFKAGRDRDDYFLNLGLIRQAAVAEGLPFMNIVQASAWRGEYRVPTTDELRWLAYTSLAYGAQGISYYVYSIDRTPPRDRYEGGMANADGTPTPLYSAASELNREFVAVASQLQGLGSIGAFHTGMLPLGTSGPPDDVAIWPESPAVADLLLGYFGMSRDATEASHMLIVNLDYKRPHAVKLAARGPLSVFDARTRSWKRIADNQVDLTLPAGGGRLLRVDP